MAAQDSLLARVKLIDVAALVELLHEASIEMMYTSFSLWPLTVEEKQV